MDGPGNLTLKLGSGNLTFGWKCRFNYRSWCFDDPKRQQCQRTSHHSRLRSLKQPEAARQLRQPKYERRIGHPIDGNKLRHQWFAHHNQRRRYFHRQQRNFSFDERQQHIHFRYFCPNRGRIVSFAGTLDTIVSKHFLRKSDHLGWSLHFIDRLRSGQYHVLQHDRWK